MITHTYYNTRPKYEGGINMERIKNGLPKP